MDPVTRLASYYKLSEVIVSRMLGSTKVLDGLQVGLNVRDLMRQSTWSLLLRTDAGLKPVEEALDEYKRVCPAVFQWLQRGDFKADIPPEFLTRAQITHACRTAGRLRARLLRAAKI